jgi:ComEC/Rec2-related protein
MVVGACAPRALAIAWGGGWSALGVWWTIGAPLALLAVGCAWRWSVAARVVGFAAAALLGGALAVQDGGPPTGITRLLAVRGEVSSVKWHGLSQGFALHRVEAITPATWASPGRLFVRAPGLPGVRPGDVVEAQGVWSRDERGESLRAVAITVQPREAGARGFAWRVLDRFGEHRELAGALLLGRGDPPERADFRSAGLAHVLAVSGMHLVIAAGILVWLLRTLGLGWWLRLLLLGGFLAGYTWLTHASPATIRALAMSLAVIIAALSWREPHRLGPVSLAALVLVAWNPTIALDLGFQLSLAAVLGIVTLGMDLVKWRQRVLPLAAWPLDRPTWRLVLWSGRALADGIAIGLAATLATAPLIAWHLGQVAAWSWLTSLAASVPATLALWAGLPLLGLAGMWPEGPWEGFYRITEWSLSALTASASWGAQHLPQQVTAPPSAVALCLWPMLFIRLVSGRQLLVRGVVLLLLISVW